MVPHDVSIFCTLKAAPAYGVDYVVKLKEQCEVYAPKVRFVCMSSIPVPCERISLNRNWPGWWSKMELFRPEITGDIFFLDLDTIITDNIKDLLNVRQLTMLSDFYHPERPASGLMYLPQDCRSEVWKHWIRNPGLFMQRHKKGGDQEFLTTCFGLGVARWQDLLPNRVISYKADRVAKQGIPAGAAVVCHHGRPKPRDIGWKYPNLTYHRGEWKRNDTIQPSY